jgi:hypothetical protein
MARAAARATVSSEVESIIETDRSRTVREGALRRIVSLRGMHGGAGLCCGRKLEGAGQSCDQASFPLQFPTISFAIEATTAFNFSYDFSKCI